RQYILNATGDRVATILSSLVLLHCQHLYILEACSADRCQIALAIQRSGIRSTEIIPVTECLLGGSILHRQVADNQPATGPENPECFAECLMPVSGEVHHAVGDHHIYAVVKQWQILDIAFTKLRVGKALL